jgi:hypothetical protein
MGDEVDPWKVGVFDTTTITLFKETLKEQGAILWQEKRKGGIKVFTKMHLSEGAPDFLCMKAASTNDNKFLKVPSLPAGGIAVFDKGFNRYRHFDE